MCSEQHNVSDYYELAENRLFVKTTLKRPAGYTLRHSEVVVRAQAEDGKDGLQM
jgi:hypothetical protein